MKNCPGVSGLAQVTSYNMARKRPPQKKKKHTPSFTLPVRKEIIRAMIGPEAVREMARVRFQTTLSAEALMKSRVI